MSRLLVVMGSGETAPTMVKPHRQLFERLEADGPVPAVVLDTPFGFQANADDISARAVEYFAASVGRPVEVAELRRRDGADPLAWEAGIAQVARARWVFAGPGSPTYALRQWVGTEMPELLADKLTHEGCVVFASAAALTLGRYTVPVYEIYKVGADPEWARGLDLLGFLGSDIAVIPHYDNAEGGTHDTRFCYLGEKRLARLEEQMADDGWVLGVDEHTGCVFDLDAGTATIVGNGAVTVRRRGESSLVASGECLTISALVDMAFGKRKRPATVKPASAAPAGDATDGGRAPTALHGEIRRIEEEFEAAVAAKDVDAAVRAVLSLDDTLVAWSSDTTQSDAGDRGRAALRRMIVRLGALATAGVADRRDIVGGYVEALLEERAEARLSRRFADADRVRDALVAHGIDVHDSPDGTTWELADR